MLKEISRRSAAGSLDGFFFPSICIPICFYIFFLFLYIYFVFFFVFFFLYVEKKKKELNEGGVKFKIDQNGSIWGSNLIC
jgi:hypothetical protein